MPRPGYINFRVTDDNRAHLAAICAFLYQDPEAHGAQVDAVNYALRLAAEHIARSWVERPPEPKGDAESLTGA